MVGAETPRSELPQRTAVGVAMAAVAVIALWLGGATLWGLLTIVSVIVLIEWASLVHARRTRLGVALVLLLAGLSYALPMLWGTDRSTVALLLISALIFAMFPRSAGVAVGLGYIGTAAIATFYLREQPNGFLLTLWTLAIVVATDVGAYFAGRAIGGAKLAPTISPNKTWAGLIGGVVAAGVVGGLIAYFGHLSETALLLGGLLALVAQAGDLLESSMKRRADVKDSGTILPGHGGLLDRIDGLMPVAIVVAGLVANGSF